MCFKTQIVVVHVEKGNNQQLGCENQQKFIVQVCVLPLTIKNNITSSLAHKSMIIYNDSPLILIFFLISRLCEMTTRMRRGALGTRQRKRVTLYSTCQKTEDPQFSLQVRHDIETHIHSEWKKISLNFLKKSRGRLKDSYNSKEKD